MEADHVDVLSLAVFGDFQQLGDVGEAGFAGQLGGDVVVFDLADGVDFDLALFHGIAPAHLDVRVHPDADTAGDVAAADGVAEALGEHHKKHSKAVV